MKNLSGGPGGCDLGFPMFWRWLATTTKYCFNGKSDNHMELLKRQEWVICGINYVITFPNFKDMNYIVPILSDVPKGVWPVVVING